MFARFESQSLLHYLKICLVAVLVTSSVSVKSQGMTVGNIYTIAGLGPNNAGYSGDGGAATSAELDRPSGVALDSAGNLYIADYYENRVRKITPAGVISTFAGNGTYGHNGDGDAATSAELAYPAAIAVDTTGNVYFTEIGNADVREVTTNGLIQTIAGTGAQNYNGDGIPATTADLYEPYGIAVDSSGSIYVADTENERIRKFTVGGLISTVAGTGTGGFSGDGGSATSANLSGPQGVAVDSSGNIYIADYGNSRIREVYASTGNINTIAGNGMPGNSGDGGTPTGAEIYAGNVTVDTSSNIYIGSNMDIRTISASTGLITTIAGNGTIGYSGDGGPATSAELGGGPDGLAVDSSGDVYIADANNAVVREIYETVTSGDNPPASYSPTSALCSEGTLPDDHISNLDGPLSNGYAVMLSLDSNARTSREQCSWGGFPSIVLTAPAVLSFSASTYTSGSGSSASFTVSGYGGNPVGEISPYSGTFTLTIPAGTNIASITIRGTTVCGGGSNSEGELIIGPITIVQ